MFYDSRRADDIMIDVLQANFDLYMGINIIQLKSNESGLFLPENVSLIKYSECSIYIVLPSKVYFQYFKVFKGFLMYYLL